MPVPATSITILDETPEAKALCKVLILYKGLACGDIKVSNFPVDSSGIVIKFDTGGCVGMISLVRELREQQEWSGGFIAITDKVQELKNMSLSLDPTHMKFGRTEGHTIVNRPIKIASLLGSIINLKTLGCYQYKELQQKSLLISRLKEISSSTLDAKTNILECCQLILNNPVNHNLKNDIFPLISELNQNNPDIQNIIKCLLKLLGDHYAY
jgi:hypothetical protein